MPLDTICRKCGGPHFAEHCPKKPHCPHDVILKPELHWAGGRLEAHAKCAACAVVAKRWAIDATVIL